MKEKWKQGINSGTGLVIAVAVIYILLGLAMLFLPNFEPAYIIYAAGLILIVYGIILIVKYFLSASYRDLGKYGFSCGVLCVLLGICMLIRAAEISSYFSVFLGICILLTAILKLQNAVDLKSIENPVWLVFLIIAVVFLAASLCIILNPIPSVTANTTYIYYILTADGIVNLISTIYLAFAIHMSKKITAGKKEKAEKEAALPAAEAEEMSADTAEAEAEYITAETEAEEPQPEADEIEEEILSVFQKRKPKRGKSENKKD